MNDRRYMGNDGRNPYGSRGGYVVSSRGRGRGRRGRRGDRAMDYEGQDMRMGDYGDVTRRGRYGDYGEDMARGYDRAGQDYGYDGHHMGRQGGYEPVEFMGYCSGYYGSPEQDYARGGDMRYDMRRGAYRMDYGDYRRGERDYGYDDYGDYGETLSEKELDAWCKKLKAQLDEREKQMFSKEAIAQKAKQMGKPMEGFGEKELEVATLMVLTDYKQTIGANLELAIKLAYDWLNDKDAAVKGAEKLAVYYDNIVEGE